MKQFKRIISLVIAMTMLVSMFSVGMVSASAETQSYMLGDVNFDGSVTIFDATAIQRSVAKFVGYEIEEGSIKFAAADVNGDEKVSIFDATLIQQFVAHFATVMEYGIGDTFTFGEVVDPSEDESSEVESSETPSSSEDESSEVESSETPSSEDESSETPSSEEESSETPSSEEESSEAPSSEEESSETPSSEEPSSEEPSSEEESSEEPSSSETPSSEEESSEAPSSEEPSSEEESSEAPSSEETKLEVGYYLVGKLNGVDCWSVDALTADRLLKANPATAGEYMLDWTFVGGDELKVAHFDGEKFDKWFNDGGDNYMIGATSNKVGPGTIYFRPEGNADWSYNFFTVQPRTVDPTDKPTDAPSSEEESSEAPSSEEPSSEEESSEAPSSEEPSKTTVTIYFENNWKWPDAKIYYWGSKTATNPAWNGIALTDKVDTTKDGYDIYKFELPADVTGFLFNGTGQYGAEQSADIKDGWHEGICYYMTYDEATNTKPCASYDYKPVVPTEAPSSEEPSSEEESSETPSSEEPSSEEESSETPSSEEPSSEEESSEAPSSEEPSSEEESSEAPSSEETKLEVGYYLVGKLNGVDCWSVDALTADRLLKANPATAGEYMLDWTFVGGDELKVAHFDGEKFDKWFNDGGDNYLIGATSNKVGPGTIYFRPEGNADWSYNFFTVQPKTVDPTEAPSSEEPSSEEESSEAPSTEEPSTEEESSEAPSSEEPSSEEESSEAPSSEEPSKTTVTIYFENNWKWPDAKIYYWGSKTATNPAWNGIALTDKVDTTKDGYDIYKFELPADVTGFLFNGTGQYGAEQSADIKDGWHEGICYYMTYDEATNTKPCASYEYKPVVPTEEPSSEEPSSEEESSETPSSEEPSSEEESSEAPSSEEPSSEEESSEAPSSEEPSSEEESSEAPSSEEPSSDEESSEAPSSEETKLEAGYYLVGMLNGVDCWSVDALTADRLLKANPAVAGEYMLDWTFVGGDEIKVAHFDGEKFDKWFNDGGDNYLIGATSNKVGPGTIYFRPEGNADWSYNFFTVQPKTVDPTEKPTDAPSSEEESSEAPSSEEPSSEEESSETPSSEEPSSEEESSEAPSSEEPSSEEESSEAPSSEEPSSEEESSEAPSSEEPSSEEESSETPSSEEPTEPTTEETKLEVGYYLVGMLNGIDCWSVDTLTADRLLKANPATAGEYMLDWTFVGGDELKVAHFDGEKFDKWFNDGGDNYMIGATSNKVGPGTIYFRPEGNADWSYNFFTVQPKTVDPTDKPTEAPSSEEPSSEEESSEAPSSEEPSSEEESSEAPTEKPTEAPTYVAYFVNSGKWSKVNAYAWDPANAAWPGQAMTKTADKAPNGADVYTITFKTNYANIIFNDGSSQTSDLKFQAGQYFDYATGKWYAKLSDIPAAAVTGYTVYCVNSKKWSTVNCYVWGPNGASWPGSKMTKTGEKSSKGYDIYSFNSVQNHTNCIFNNGSGSQTADLKFTAGQYFDLATGKWYADASTI